MVQHAMHTLEKASVERLHHTVVLRRIDGS